MKKKSPGTPIPAAKKFLPLAFGLLIYGGGTFLLPMRAQANAETDRQFALERVGFLKSWDNVDGLFVDYVADAYRDYFSRQSRFVLQDLSKADVLLSKSKLPYNKLIEDADILGQISRATRAESIIRTKILKEGPQYQFQMDWLHSPRMELMSSVTFVLQEPSGGKGFGIGDVRDDLQKALDQLIGKVPFLGNVTGRDNNQVTLNIGQNANLKKGDTLSIATLDEVKKHPLLKQIVDWRLTATGKVEIESVEDRISFGRVTQEEDGRQIGRFQKVIQIIPATKAEQPVVIDEKAQAANRDEPPKLGWIAGNLGLGSFSRTFTDTTTLSSAISDQGGGFNFGLRGDGELWFNREFFADISMGFNTFSYSANLIAGGNSPGQQDSGSSTSFKIAGGYSYLVNGDFYGPKGWLKFGYHTVSFNLTTPNLGPTSIKGLFLGVGGDLPIREQWGALLNLDFGFLSGASESTQAHGDASSTTDVELFIGGYYRFTQRITFRAGIDITANNQSFAKDNDGVTQKIVTFTPSLVYYF